MRLEENREEERGDNRKDEERRSGLKDEEKGVKEVEK